TNRTQLCDLQAIGLENEPTEEERPLTRTGPAPNRSRKSPAAASRGHCIFTVVYNQRAGASGAVIFGASLRSSAHAADCATGFTGRRTVNSEPSPSALRTE